MIMFRPHFDSRTESFGSVAFRFSVVVEIT